MTDSNACCRCGVKLDPCSLAIAREVASARASVVGYECPLYCVACEQAEHEELLREHMRGEEDVAHGGCASEE